MPRFFVKKEQVKKTTIEILGEDIKHIKNVLRKQIGEDIEICDKDTKKSYICEIEKIEEKSILTKIIEELQSNDNKIEVASMTAEETEGVKGGVVKKLKEIFDILKGEEKLILSVRDDIRPNLTGQHYNDRSEFYEKYKSETYNWVETMERESDE